MKLFYRLLLFMGLMISSSTLSAREIILITYTHNNKTLKMLKKQFNEHFKIPILIIKYEKISGKCKNRNDVILQFCIEGDEVKQMTKHLDIVKKAFPVFLNDDLKNKKMEISNEQSDT